MGMSNSERTHITDLGAEPFTTPLDAEPCVILRFEGLNENVVFLEDGAPPSIFGRGQDADVILNDTKVSREHLQVQRVGDKIIATDLGSTNGTWLQGSRLDAPHTLQSGQFLRVGGHSVTIGWRSRIATQHSKEITQDLEKASKYVLSLLPERVPDGPVQLDWSFLPSTKLGGDVFGYHNINSRFLAGYLIDVSGHGAGAARHSTSILAALRNQTLPGVDFTNPSEVLAALNDAFDMEKHDGYCFTIWYGAYDLKTRVLRYGSAGHHPAFLVLPGGGAPIPLRTRNPVMGAMPGISFESADIQMPRDGRVHIFSDGCFEIVDRDGAQWGLQQFLPILTETADGVEISAQSVLDIITAYAKPGPLGDDFSFMSVRFR